MAKDPLPAPLPESRTGFYFFHFIERIPSETVMQTTVGELKTKNGVGENSFSLQPFFLLLRWHSRDFDAEL